MTPPDVQKAIDLARIVYTSSNGGAGCCLHIMLDDGNLRDSDGHFCYGYAAAKGHDHCVEAALQMLQLSSTQRKAVYNAHSEYAS